MGRLKRGCMGLFRTVSGARAALCLAAFLLAAGSLLIVYSVPGMVLAAQEPLKEGPSKEGVSKAAFALSPATQEPFNMFAPVPGAPDAQSSFEPNEAPDGEPEEEPIAGDIRIEVVRRTPHPTGPTRVLIYHTHTWEAYEPTAEAPYRPTQRWRTMDHGHNVARVGAELARHLRELGMEVVHDASDLEPPNLSTAYSRSLALLEAYRQRGETFDVYIDLHRDAYNNSMRNTNTVTADGVEMARISLVIGKGTGQTGVGFDQKPNWEVNIRLAQAITDALNAQVPDLARPVLTKSQRYNQHFAESAVLIEVGNNGNTLEQALAAMPYLARAIERALRR